VILEEAETRLDYCSLPGEYLSLRVGSKQIMPAYNGKHITLKNLVVHIFGIEIKITGELEVLDIRKKID
jgi:hypothetical protein